MQWHKRPRSCVSPTSEWLSRLCTPCSFESSCIDSAWWPFLQETGVGPELGLVALGLGLGLGLVVMVMVMVMVVMIIWIRCIRWSTA